MKYGDKEGLNLVYTDVGAPILRDEEKILAREKGIIPTLKTTWRVYGGETLISSIKGDVYLTTDRLLFIGEREDVFLIGSKGARSAQDLQGLGLRSLTTSGIRDFFEIPNLEIMGVERKRGFILAGELIYIYILSQGKQYHLQMTLRNGSPLLKRLLSKEVPSLDDLVKNLKRYFQITDWMYTESEKAAWRDIIEKKRAEADRVVREEGILPPEEGEVIKPTKEEAKKIDGLTIDYFRKLLERGLITPKMYEKLTGEKAPQIEKEEVPEAVEATQTPAPTTVSSEIEAEKGEKEEKPSVIPQVYSPVAPSQEGPKEPSPVSLSEETPPPPPPPGDVEPIFKEAKPLEKPSDVEKTPPGREDIEKMLEETLEMVSGESSVLPPPPPPVNMAKESLITKKASAGTVLRPPEEPQKEPPGIPPILKDISPGEGRGVSPKPEAPAGSPKGKKVKAKKIILKIKKPKK